MQGSKQTPAQPVPTSLTVHKVSRLLDIGFDDGSAFSLPFELMRVYSPSAEVRGHGKGQEVLQTGKRRVAMLSLEPVGNYAVQPHFSDGHDSGLYTWEYLYWLGENQEQLWEQYFQRLEAAGFTRESGRDLASAPAAPQGGGCGGGHKH